MTVTLRRVHLIAADSSFLVPGAGFGLFFLFWLGLFVVGFGGFIVGVIALIDVAQTPAERFGPWWDNMRQQWLIGIAVSFVLPLGPLIVGILWFNNGRRGLRTTGLAGRPFWAAPPKPPPPWGPTPPGWAPGPPPPPPPPGWGPPPAG
ncbi:MAG TPA: hypothetical protein VFJ98_10475 [Mycobacteriales bacterium]|nr:hypothetical protein [Mycobacteriales bacterium]